MSLLDLIEIPDHHRLLNNRSPAFETKNSPVITPTKDKPIFIFSEFINVDTLAGIIILVKSCNLEQLKLFAILIFS